MIFPHMSTWTDAFRSQKLTLWAKNCIESEFDSQIPPKHLPSMCQQPAHKSPKTVPKTFPKPSQNIPEQVKVLWGVVGALKGINPMSVEKITRDKETHIKQSVLQGSFSFIFGDEM